MNDLEVRLTSGLHQPLPPAPQRLRARIDALPLSQGATGRRPARRRLAAVWGFAIAFVVVVLASSLMFGGFTQRPMGGSLEPSAASSAGSTASPLPDAMTVSEFIERRDLGELGSAPVLVRGFWTDRRIPVRCGAPRSQPGELELFCYGDMFGITENDEAIGTLMVDDRWVPASGPAITPFVPQTLVEKLFDLPTIHGQRYPPVPIVVQGHVNDHRAAECRPEAMQRCRDRLVIDEIVQFDPHAIPTPGITPSPSPFPFDDPPPPPFTKDRCAGDVAYSFVGWGRLADVGLDSSNPDVVYIMVTTGDVDLSDGGNGPRGRRVCYAYEWDREDVSFDRLPSH